MEAYLFLLFLILKKILCQDSATVLDIYKPKISSTKSMEVFRFDYMKSGVGGNSNEFIMILVQPTRYEDNSFPDVYIDFVNKFEN